MTPLSKRTRWALAAAIAALLVAAAPAGAARGENPKEPVATVVAGVPVVISGQFATGTASVSCPKGTQAIAGGFSSTKATSEATWINAATGPTWINLYESRRAGAGRWQVSGTQMHPGQGDLTAYASCQSLKAKVKTRSITVPLGLVNSTVTGLARCTGGRKVLSGGFVVPPANSASSALVSRSILGNGIGWVVDAARLAGADAASLTAYSYCAEIGKTKTRSASATVLGSTGAAQEATTPACPRGTPLRGGGFATSTPVNGVTGSALVFKSRPVDSTWRSAAIPGGKTTASTLVSNSYCRA